MSILHRLSRPNPLRAQLLALLLALPALSMTQAATAATFCVNSEATAQAALTTAATNGQADIIRFRSGAITLTSGLVFSTAGGGADHLALTLTGGFNADCTQRTGSTVLNGNNSVRVLDLQLFGPQSLAVEHLTLLSGYSSSGGNLYVRLYNQGGGASLRIDNNAILLGSAQTARGALDISGWGTLRIRNNLITGNSASNYAVGTINLNGNSFLSNNTITGNSNTDGEGWVLYTNPTSTSSNLWLSNNILWGNDSYGDVYLFGQGTINLVHNNIGRHTNVPLGPASGGNLSVDPQFDSCGFLCFDKPLKSSSPMVDAGVNNPQGGLLVTDFDGNPRLMGPAVDIGAFELWRFADGFE